MGRPKKSNDEKMTETKIAATHMITRSKTRKLEEANRKNTSVLEPEPHVVPNEDATNDPRRLTQKLNELTRENHGLKLNVERFKNLAKSENREKTRLENELKKMRETQSGLEMTIERMDNKLSDEVKKKVDQGLQKERDKTAFYRGKMLEMARRLEVEQRGPDKQPPAWKLCEICTLEYKDAPGRIPRILKCGHTLCEDCVAIISHGTRRILCPFDRQATMMATKSPKSLMKNYTVLNM